MWHTAGVRKSGELSMFWRMHPKFIYIDSGWWKTERRFYPQTHPYLKARRKAQGKSRNPINQKAI